jgi:hypothetical protein
MAPLEQLVLMEVQAQLASMEQLEQLDLMVPLAQLV